MANNSVLAKMAVQITADNARFKAALSKSQQDLSSFTGGITKLAGAIGVAFSVHQVASFAVEVSRLAGEAEGVRTAFERLPNSIRLMSELKRATGGTVSELDLMKRAVQASNFDISLEALPRLLEFATLRAQQTGQSVDYLVDSIVTGIGRKSKLILDNLGISAVQLTEALGGASAASSSIEDVANAVGRIAEKNLQNMAGFAENASTKMQRLSASWEDLKVAVGTAANETGFFNQVLTQTTQLLNAISGDKFTQGFNKLLAGDDSKLRQLASEGVDITMTWQELLAKGFVRVEGAAKKYEKVLAKIAEEQKNMALASGPLIDPLTGVPLDGSGLTRWDPSMIEKQIVTLDSLKEKEKELLEQFEQIDDADDKRQKNKAEEIILIRAQIKAIEDLLKVEEAYTLSRAGQGALAGDAVTKVTQFGQQIIKPSMFEGGFLKAGEETSLADPIQVDIDKMAELAQKMVELRNESLKTKTEMVQHWIDLSGIVGGAITSLAEGLGGAIVGVEDFGETVLQAFTGFAKEFGSMLIASGIAALALDKLITNPAAAIAAGVALVAIAGAASASLQKSHSALTGSGGSAPGRLPSQVNVQIGGRIRGYDLALVADKEAYRRGRMG